MLFAEPLWHYEPVTVIKARKRHPRALQPWGLDQEAGAAFAQIGIIGFDGQTEVEALRLDGRPEAAPALLCGAPTLAVGLRELAAEVS